MERWVKAAADSLDFLTGGGDMGARMRGYDWDGTPFGPPETWPQSLRSALSICLGSSFQVAIYWGRELALLYNDAWSQIPGQKHPWALGRPGREVWPEIWDTIGPMFERVLSTGEATRSHDQLLAMHRHGFTEECYFDYTFSPIRDEAGSVGGIFNIAVETTFRVIGERRTRLLKDLGELTTRARTAEEACGIAATALATDVADLPFCLIYLTNGPEAKLAGASGLGFGTEASPLTIELSQAAPPWPVAEALKAASPVLVEDLTTRFRIGLPGGSWPEQCARAVVVPFPQVGRGESAGALVCGISPRLVFDTEYQVFVDRVANLTSTAVSNARAYEEERKRAEALAELDRAKTAFFSNVSHEFRTPLTLMLGPLDDLQQAGGLSAEHSGLLRVVHRNALRLQRLVNTLLDFSRIEAGRAQATYEPTDLASLTADVASSFRSAMERAGLQFTIELAPLREQVFVDREMWEKVVLNLLSNAFKYTLEGSVTIRLGEREGRAELSVSDTGVGIPAEEMPRLFERFHRIEDSHGRTHEGTGIGLALVQELVRLHGGTVWAESAVGRGSVFRVAIPFGKAHLPPDRIGASRGLASTAVRTAAFVEEALSWLPDTDTPPGAPTASPGGTAEHSQSTVFGDARVRSRVLLADDNSDMRNYVGRLLSSDHEVVSVSNGEEALRAALAQPPDLVLTDVMMPVLDGFGLLKALRENERTKLIPILLLSARAGEESRVEGLSAGADDYLVKPFSARELLARVEAHLSLARMRKEADRARRLSEARLSLAIEATKMFAWEWDPRSDEVHGAGDMASIFGAVLASSREGFQLVHPDDEPAHRAKVERVVRDGGSYHSEFRIRRADTGATAWLEERATAITDEDGRVVRVVGVIADVTDRKTAEEEMRRSNEKLQRANLDLEQFAYSASHDLREPLRMVAIYSQLLQRRYKGRLDEPADQYLDVITQAAHRMDALVGDLLSYTQALRSPEGDAPLTSATAALHQALANLRTAIDESGATVAAGPLPHLRVNEVHLVQVLQNLFSNAIKYRGEAPVVITVSAECAESVCTVRVRDNGIGIEPNHHEQIFGLFKRLHTQNRYSGTGIGLALCQTIVQRNGGRIWVESEGLGHGSTFCFSLRGEWKPEANQP